MTIYNHHEGNKCMPMHPQNKKNIQNQCVLWNVWTCFWGTSVRRQKKKATGMLRVPLAFFFCLKLFLHLSPPHQDKGGETACVCVCVFCFPLENLHCVFSSCLYTKGICFMFPSHKKKGLRNGFDHSPFPCIKDSRTRGIIHITILFSRPKNHDENNKKIQHNIWHTLHDSNILLSNIRSLRSKSWNGYWEISWLWKLNESKRREGLEGLLLGRVPHWEGWDVGFAVKWSNLTSIFFAWVVQPPTR